MVVHARRPVAAAGVGGGGARLASYNLSAVLRALRGLSAASPALEKLVGTAAWPSGAFPPTLRRSSGTQTSLQRVGAASTRSCCTLQPAHCACKPLRCSAALLAHLALLPPSHVAAAAAAAWEPPEQPSMPRLVGFRAPWEPRRKDAGAAARRLLWPLQDAWRWLFYRPRPDYVAHETLGPQWKKLDSNWR